MKISELSPEYHRPPPQAAHLTDLADFVVLMSEDMIDKTMNVTGRVTTVGAVVETPEMEVRYTAPRESLFVNAPDAES